MFDIRDHGGGYGGGKPYSEVNAMGLNSAYIPLSISDKGERYTFVNRETNNRSVVKFDSRGSLIWDKKVLNRIPTAANENGYMTASDMGGGKFSVNIFRYDNTLIRTFELNGVGANSRVVANFDMTRFIAYNYNGFLVYDENGLNIGTSPNIPHGQSNVYTYCSSKLAIHYSTSMYGAFQLGYFVDMDASRTYNANSYRAMSLTDLSVLGLVGLKYI